MALPAGISTATVTFGIPTTFQGAAVPVSINVTPSTDLVWSADGTPLISFIETTAPAVSTLGTVTLPHVDQNGFQDNSGNAYKNWYYTATLTYQHSSDTRVVTKVFQPLVGQTTIDLDLIPSGAAQLPYSAPTGVATSVVGQTGAVTGGQIAADPTVSAIYGRGFSIKDPQFGAKGDGVTNDTAALQNAIHAAEAVGGIVFIPQGTYLVVLPQINVGGITIQGSGAKSKLLLAPASLAATGNTIGLWVNGAANVTIRDLQIDGNFANIAKDGTYQSASTLWTPVISTYGAQSVKTYKMGSGGGIDATTYLHYRMPIRITDADNVKVENCLIVNSVSAGILADGTSVNSCKNITITGNRIKLTWDNGIYFHQGVQYGTAALNTISDTTYNGVSAVYCDHIMVNDNDIRFAGPSDSDSGGVQINGSSNCTVTGNLIDQCQFYGVDVLSTQETNITGGAGGNAVFARTTVVSANTITGCHANDYPTHNAPGINVFGGTDTTITNNTVNNCDYGVSMGSHALNTVIASNRLSGNSSLGINVGNSADVIGTVIRGNFIGYNKSHGIYGNAPARYEGNTIIGNIGMGVNLSSTPSGMPQKTDYVIGNTIMDNTDSGMLTGGGTNCLSVIERNFFGNSLGVVFTDASIVYNSTTITSATAGFTNSDVGLPVFIVDQGANDVLTTTTIASVTNATTAVLASPAQATETGVTFSIGRGPVFFTGASVAGTALTAPAGTFLSTDGGKLITIYRAEPNLSPIFTGTISSYTSGTAVTLSGAAGTYTPVVFVLNRSAGQQARAINNFADNPVINRNNTFYGIPELLNGGGTTNQTLNRVSNVADPVLPTDAATKNYVDTLSTGVNVKAYGAKGDGTTDDTAAIQAAHDALPAQGGRIHFPHGKYLVSSTITISKPVTLTGEGSGDHTGGQGTANTGTTYTPTAQGSVIFTTSQTIDVFVVNASGFAATDLAVVNTAATAPTAGTGIRVTRGDGAHLTRVRTAGFWNNISFEQSEYATFVNCLFIDPVNYGLWTRNLVQSDQGDMTLTGCAFSYSGSVNRTGATAVRWESGGGLKLSGCKINMGPRGGVGKFTIGVYIAAADGVSTSVFIFDGNSFENTTAAGILVRPLGTTGQISKMTIIGNEFSANGVAIDVEGYSATLPFKNLTITGNHVDGSTNAIYLKNVNGFAIGPNNLNVTVNGVLVDTGCQNGVIGRQVVLGSTSNVIQNNSSTLFSDHTTGPVDVDWHDKRNIPSTTSTSTYTNLHSFGVSPYAAGVVEVTISAIVQGVGSGTKVLKRSFTRGSSGVSSVTTVGTDVASGANFDVNFDTSSAAGNVVAQIRLNSVTGGTDINGSSTIDVKGDVNALNRN